MLCNYFHNRFLVPGAKDLLPRISSAFSCYLHCNLILSRKQFSQRKSVKETVERTITAEDVKTFSDITGDHNTIHSPSAKGPGVVHGALLNGILSGVIGTKLPGFGAVVISQTLSFPKPCHIGDTVIVTVEIDHLRKIIPCKYKIINKQSNDVVMEGEAKLLYKTPTKVDD